MFSTGYLRKKGTALDEDRLTVLTKQGKTVVFVLVENRPAMIALAEIIREDSKEAIRALKCGESGA